MRGTSPIRVYISGPMTDMPDNNFPAFNEAARLLERHAFHVVNPADNGIIRGWEWDDYLRYDLSQMLTCDAIFMLDGWAMSRGALLEHHVAKALGFGLVRIVNQRPVLDGRV